MHTRRSARVRAANALRTSTAGNEAQDENNLENTQKQEAARKPAAAAKQNVRLRRDPSHAKTPLRDLTNNARTTRPRRPRKTVDKPSKPNIDETEVNDDAEITAAQEKPSTRRKTRRSKPAIVREDSRAAKDPRAETELGDIDKSSAQDIQPDAGSTPYSPQTNETAPTLPSKGERLTRRNIETELETRSSSPSTDEIQPNQPKADAPREDHQFELSGDEIQPNSPVKKQRTPSLLSESSDEIQPGPARNEKFYVDSLASSGIRQSSPVIRDSRPLSPVASELPGETHQGSRMTENLEPSGVDLDTKRPPQAVYTYGKRRRVARVSLPTMKALGVRAKSPSSESPSGSEKDADESLSDASAESDGESEKSPKRNPKLRAFVTEQKKLWEEVDEIDLLVESD